MSNYCRKKDCARKTPMTKKVLRPCLESLRIPTPCTVPLNLSVMHPHCQYRNYNNYSPEMCNTLDFNPSPDICPFSNKYYRAEENRRDESFSRRTNNDYEYDEAADLRDEESNQNIERASLFVTPQIVSDEQPTKMRSKNLNSRDDVRHVGISAAPETCCKGNQIPIMLTESNDYNEKPDSPLLSDKEIQTPIKNIEDLNRSPYPYQSNRSQANQTNPNFKFPEYRSEERFLPSQSALYNSSIPDINRSTGFMSPPRYSGPIDRDTSRQPFYSNENQDGSSCCMNKSYANMAHDNVAQNIPYLQNSPRSHPRETCCKESGLTNPDFNLPRFNSKYQALQNYNRTSITQEGCCSQINDRVIKRKKSLRSVICACPGEYELYSREVKCSKKTCEREDDSSCLSVSCAANQAGPSCRCRYPPLFKQFSCAGNINGTCNCIDNF